MSQSSRIFKVAGFSLVGFVTAATVAKYIPESINMAQAAGFCGAFAGAMVGRYQRGKSGSGGSKASNGDNEIREPVADDTNMDGGSKA